MESLKHTLEKQFIEYSTLMKALRNGAHGEDVHALRTLSRRLRAELWLLEQSSQVRVPPDLKSKIKKLTRTLGEARQCHVLYKDAVRYHLKADKIKEARDQARAKLTNLIDKKWQRRLFEELQEFEKSLQRKALQLNKTNARTLLTRDVEKLLKSKEPKNPDDWHQRRIGIRKLQYRLEALGFHSPALKKVQSSLGKAHDLHILKSMNGQHSKLKQDEKKALAFAQRAYSSSLKQTLKKLN